MQVCMEPQVNADLINRETCPVRIDITDSGFPEGIRALRWHERSLERNAWIRRRFGHFVVIDPWNENVVDLAYGAAGIDQLANCIAKFKERIPKYKARAIARADHALEDASDELPERLRQGPLSVEWMTAYELSFDTWPAFIDVIADGTKIAPGVQAAIIHALGEFVCQSGTIYDLQKSKSAGMATAEMAGQQYAGNSPNHGDWDIQERAAAALIRITKPPIDVESPDLLEQTRAWWKLHENDEAFRIVWSDDPKLKYAFLR
jgi:hypothetical protein